MYVKREVLVTVKLQMDIKGISLHGEGRFSFVLIRAHSW